MSKPLSELRSLLTRTGTFVSSANLRRLLPAPDEEPPTKSGRYVPVGRPEPESERLIDRLPRWAKLRSIERQTVSAGIEGTSLRAVALAGRRVVGWTEVPLDERAARGGQINDPLVLGAAIDQAFEQFQLPRRGVSWALPAFQATTRILELPNLKGDELRQAISDEFERMLGASMSDSYLYWQRLPGRIRQRNVFALAVPKTTVLSALEALEVADIRPDTMDLRPLALARAIGRADAIIANLEDGSLDLVIVERNVPTLVRSIPLVGASAGREAAQNRLVEETERTLAYYDDSNPDHPLDVDAPIFLTGSLATGIALAERMRAITRHPIGRLAAAGITYPPEFPMADFAVTLGLSLKQT